MPIRSIYLSSLLTLAFASHLAAYTVGSHYQVSVLASTVTAYDYTQFEGIAKSGDTLYVGNFRSVKQVNLRTGAVSDYGSLPGNNGISHVTYANGQVYASSFVSYNNPFPYTMHSVSEGGTTSEVLTMGGIFDARTSPTGDFYFVANPDLDGDNWGDGSRLYRLNYDDNSVTEVAYLGGASGGLAFDAAGNLFYAHYDHNTVYSFGADKLLAGGLDLADAQIALLLENPGYLGFNDQGHLLATRLDEGGQILSAYDLVSGLLIEDIFTTQGQELIGGFLYDEGTLYVAWQNWDFMGDYGSELLALTAVPEPAAFALLFALAAAGVAFYRRRGR